MVVPRTVLGNFKSVSKIRKTPVIVHGLLNEWELEYTPLSPGRYLQALLLSLPSQNSSKKYENLGRAYYVH